MTALLGLRAAGAEGPGAAAEGPGAAVEVLPPESPWCEAAAVLAAPAQDAVRQVALWKLVDEDASFPVEEVEEAAVALVERSRGACPLTCGEAAVLAADLTALDDGLVYGQVRVQRRGGAPQGGLELDIEVAGGELLEPAGGRGLTDDSGLVPVIVSPGGESFTLVAGSPGLSLVRLGVGPASGTALPMVYERCLVSTEARWQARPAGSPRTLDFWRSQAVATSSDGPLRAAVRRRHLDEWLPVTALGETAWDLDGLYELIGPVPRDDAQAAVQACLATALNVASGELGWHTRIDPHRAGQDPVAVWELWAEAEEHSRAGRWSAAAAICTDLNQGGG